MQRTKDIFSFGGTGTEKTAKLHENGIGRAYVMKVPNFTNVVTATLSILDDDGDIVYTGDAKAKNNVYLVTGLTVPCDRNYTVKVTLSGDAGGNGGDVVVKLYLEQA